MKKNKKDTDIIPNTGIPRLSKLKDGNNLKHNSSVEKDWQVILQENESNPFRFIFDNATDVYFITDMNGNLIDVNLAAETASGFTKNELLGENIFSSGLIPENEVILAHNLISLNKQGKKTGPDEFHLRRKNGKYVDIEVTSMPVNFGGSKMILSIARDISRRKKLQNTLSEEQEKFHSIANAALDAIVMIDELGKVTYWNQAAEKIFGYNTAEICGAQIHDVIAPERYRSAFAEGFKMYKINGTGKAIGKVLELQAQHCDGHEFPVELAISGIKLNGKWHASAIIRDITKRKAAELEIQKLSQAVEQSPASIVLTDTAGNIEYVNKKFSEVTGFEKSEAIGKNPRILKSGELPEDVYKNLWETILSGNEWHGELHNRKKNGELYWEKASISPVINSDGKIINFLAVKEDITQRKIIESELRRAKEIAETASKAKSEFLANISHEIRTPLNGVIGTLNLLQQTNPTPEQQELIDMMNFSGKTLLKLVNDVLDFSRLQTANIILEREKFSLRTCLKNHANGYKNAAIEKNIDLKFEIDRRIPEHFSGDVRRLKQVLENLLSNAFKFTSAGFIKIQIRMESETDKDVFLHFSVNDSGSGIPKEKIGRLFHRFSQVDGSSTRLYGGAGLGLAISKEIVKLFNGEIRAESPVLKNANDASLNYDEFWVNKSDATNETHRLGYKPGPGSCFSFTAKLNKDTEETIEIENKIEKETKKTEIKTSVSAADNFSILLAEDNPVNQKIAMRMISKKGWRVDAVADGRAAVEAWNLYGYDLILMDIQMPVMDGYEAIAEIRRLERNLSRRTPIIALTANAMNGDREKCIAAGADEYMSKPILADSFYNLIERIKSETE